MLDHISLPVADLQASAAFYDAALAALGYVRVWSFEDAIGYGPEGGGDKLAIKHRDPTVNTPSPGFHLAFTAADNASVSAFHVAALATLLTPFFARWRTEW